MYAVVSIPNHIKNITIKFSVASFKIKKKKTLFLIDWCRSKLIYRSINTYFYLCKLLKIVVYQQNHWRLVWKGGPRVHAPRIVLKKKKTRVLIGKQIVVIRVVPIVGLFSSSSILWKLKTLYTYYRARRIFLFYFSRRVACVFRNESPAGTALNVTISGTTSREKSRTSRQWRQWRRRFNNSHASVNASRTENGLKKKKKNGKKNGLGARKTGTHVVLVTRERAIVVINRNSLLQICFVLFASRRPNGKCHFFFF